MIRIVRYVFLLFAVALLGSYFYSFFERTAYQAYDNWKFDREVPKEAPLSPPRAEPPAPPADGIIGRISVPRLHLSAMVREGIDDKTLDRAVGHMPSSPLPGQNGNVALAGHRDTFFRELKGLEARDEIRFSTRHGNFKYRVERMMIVEPSNVSVLAQDQAKRLTIVTCYPFTYVGNAPKRFVVQAAQID